METIYEIERTEGIAVDESSLLERMTFTEKAKFKARMTKERHDRNYLEPKLLDAEVSYFLN